MKLNPEVRRAIGLAKEYGIHMKYATRPGAPKAEQNYFYKMAASTSARVDWNLLNKKKQNPDQDYMAKESDY